MTNMGGMAANCTYHAKEPSVEYCDQCRANLCYVCTYSHRATYPAHVAIDKQSAAKAILERMFYKLNYCVPTECAGLREMLAEYRGKLAELLRKLELAMDKVLSGVGKEIEQVDKQRMEWNRDIERGRKMYAELFGKFQKGEYDTVIVQAGERGWFHDLVPPCKVPSFLAISLAERALRKLCGELNRDLSPEKREDIESELPVVHFVDDSKVPTVLHCYYVLEGRTRSTELSGVKLSRYFDSAQLCNSVYVTGGYADMKAVAEVYSWPVSGEVCGVAHRAGMLYPKFNHTLVTVPGEIMYCLGGSVVGPHDDKLDTSVCEQYSPDLDSWTEAPSLNSRRCGVLACVVNRRYLYVFGGRASRESRDCGIVEVLDRLMESAGWIMLRTEGTWVPRHSGAAVQVGENAILLMGGYSEKSLGLVEEFSTAVNRFEDRRKMPQVSSFQQRKAVVCGGEVYIADYYYGCLYRYRHATKEWKIVQRANWIGK